MPKDQGLFKSLGKFMAGIEDTVEKKLLKIERDIPAEIQELKDEIEMLNNIYGSNRDCCALHLAIMHKDEYRDYRLETIENEMQRIGLNLDAALQEYDKKDWIYIAKASADSAKSGAKSLWQSALNNHRRQMVNAEIKAIEANKSNMSSRKYKELRDSKYIERSEIQQGEREARKESAENVRSSKTEALKALLALEKLYYADSQTEKNNCSDTQFSSYACRLISMPKRNLNKLLKIVKNEYLKEVMSICFAAPDELTKSEYKEFRNQINPQSLNQASQASIQVTTVEEPQKAEPPSKNHTEKNVNLDEDLLNILKSLQGRDEHVFDNPNKFVAMMKDLTKNNNEHKALIRWLGIALSEFNVLCTLKDDIKNNHTFARHRLIDGLISEGASKDIADKVIGYWAELAGFELEAPQTHVENASSENSDSEYSVEVKLKALENRLLREAGQHKHMAEMFEHKKKIKEILAAEALAHGMKLESDEDFYGFFEELYWHLKNAVASIIDAKTKALHIKSKKESEPISAISLIYEGLSEIDELVRNKYASFYLDTSVGYETKVAELRKLAVQFANDDINGRVSAMNIAVDDGTIDRITAYKQADDAVSDMRNFISETYKPYFDESTFNTLLELTNAYSRKTIADDYFVPWFATVFKEADSIIKSDDFIMAHKHITSEIDKIKQNLESDYIEMKNSYESSFEKSEAMLASIESKQSLKVIKQRLEEINGLLKIEMKKTSLLPYQKKERMFLNAVDKETLVKLKEALSVNADEKSILFYCIEGVDNNSQVHGFALTNEMLYCRAAYKKPVCFKLKEITDMSIKNVSNTYSQLIISGGNELRHTTGNLPPCWIPFFKQAIEIILEETNRDMGEYEGINKVSAFIKSQTLTTLEQLEKCKSAVLQMCKDLSLSDKPTGQFIHRIDDSIARRKKSDEDRRTYDGVLYDTKDERDAVVNVKEERGKLITLWDSLSDYKELLLAKKYFEAREYFVAENKDVFVSMANKHIAKCTAHGYKFPYDKALNKLMKPVWDSIDSSGDNSFYTPRKTIPNEVSKQANMSLFHNTDATNENILLLFFKWVITSESPDGFAITDNAVYKYQNYNAQSITLSRIAKIQESEPLIYGMDNAPNSNEKIKIKLNPPHSLVNGNILKNALSGLVQLVKSRGMIYDNSKGIAQLTEDEEKSIPVPSPSIVNQTQPKPQKIAMSQISPEQQKKMIAKALSPLKDSDMGLFVGESGIPPKKFANAKKTFLSGMNQSEQIYIFFDSTVFGSAKEGFALTNRGLYYKNTLENTVFIKISDITETSSEFANLIVYADSVQGARKHMTALAVQNANVAKAIQDIAQICNNNSVIAEEKNVVTKEEKKPNSPPVSPVSVVKEQSSSLQPTAKKEASTEVTSPTVQLDANQKNQLIQTALSSVTERMLITQLYLGTAIPPKKLANAKKAYLGELKPTEQIYLFYDATLFGSAKDGFVFTNERIQYKYATGNSGSIKISQIISVSAIKDTIIVTSKSGFEGKETHGLSMIMNPEVASKVIQDIVDVLNG